MNSEQVEANRAKVKEIFEDGFMEINGTEYKFTKFTHKNRLQVLAYSERLSARTTVIGDSAWQNIEELINKKLTVNDVLLSKIPDYWEDHPQDYITAITYAIGVIIYPFQQGRATS